MILDDDYAHALVSRAIRENAVGNLPTFKCRYSPKREQTVLDALVLYDKIRLLRFPNVSDLDLSFLTDEGAVDIITPPNSVWDIPTKADETGWIYSVHELLSLLNELDTLSRLPVPERPFWNLFGHHERQIVSLFRDIWRPMLCKSDLSKMQTGLTSKDYDAVLKLVLDEDHRARVQESARSLPKEDMRYLWMINNAASNLYEACYTIQLHMVTSIAYESPVLSRTTVAPKSAEFPSWNVSNDEPYFQAYGVFLDEAEYSPRADTLKDAIRLRKDKRIASFREVLSEWSRALAAGDATAESKMRKEVRRANVALSRAAFAQKTGRWLTYISLPVATASLMTGYSFGLALLPLGLGIRLYSDFASMKHGWTLVGRE